MHKLLESILGSCRYRFALHLGSLVRIARGPFWRQGIKLAGLSCLSQSSGSRGSVGYIAPPA